MQKSVHEVTMEQAFRNAGGQHYRREAEQRREHDVEREEIEAGREWLRRVEAGRIGGPRG
ncbi:MAG: hypothetical protein ABI770_08695 [Sphingomicrobium sp.]